MSFNFQIICNGKVIDKILIFQPDVKIEDITHIYLKTDFTGPYQKCISGNYNNRRAIKCCKRRKKLNLILQMNAYFLSVFVHLLKLSETYQHFISNRLMNILNIGCHSNTCCVIIQIESVNPKKHIIDYRWNACIAKLCAERFGLDYTMAWLSTLGGGFSCLGDKKQHCAIMAGKISVQQFKIALKLHDHQMVSRCKLYFAISLIQQSYLKKAAHIIANEYAVATTGPNPDNRLRRICLGIWARLKYEWEMKKQSYRNTIKYVRSKQMVSL